jgi:glyoxylase-like metal-dependent hydrolase (beta-lactamase superfamily II)
VQNNAQGPRAPLSNALTAEGEDYPTDEPRLHYLVEKAHAAGTTLEVLPGLHWLRMPLPIDLNHINLWLLEDGDGFTLIDTGMPASPCTEVWEQLESTLLAQRPLRRILLTHYHPDHMGCAGWLQARHDIPVRMASRAIPWAEFMVDGPSTERRAASVDFFRAHGMAQAREFFDALPLARNASPVNRMPIIDEPLSDGEHVAVGAHLFEVIETDGHATGHQSFFDAAGGVLISGDQILPTISPNISLSASDWGLDPLGDFLASLDRLESLPADTVVLPSHGRPFRGLRARAADLREHHHEHLDRLQAAIAVPKTAFDLMSVLFGRRLFGFHQMLGLQECIAHLEHLVQRGRARREIRDDGVQRYVGVCRQAPTVSAGTFTA